MGNNVNVDKVLDEVRKAITGKDDCISKVFAAILAGGHVLIEDVPGVGKTTLAIAFSKALSLADKRMQFTPDVMPADILGFNMYQKETGNFVYYPGAIMCNLFLADEINRTSPKTQSALLEVMEEQKVTIEGETRAVPNPFVVMATQNPKGSAGTQLLPEAQLDRFMICISMGYPNIKDEVEILKGKSTSSVANITPILSKEQLMKMKDALIDVKGVQGMDGESGTIELTTDGEFGFKDGEYVISYDENQMMSDGSKVKTIVTVSGDSVTLERSGAVNSRMTIQNGVRNVCYYSTPHGDLVLGIYGDEMECDLSEKGGRIKMAYNIDSDLKPISRNVVDITVREVK